MIKLVIIDKQKGMLMAEEINLVFDLPVYPERFYRAWMDDWEHGKMTGSTARIEARVGGSYTFLSGLAEGEFLALTPFDRIRQTWKMVSLPGESIIDLQLEPVCTGTLVHFSHIGLPNGSGRRMTEWWEETYFRPIKRYFDELVGEYVADMGDG